MNEGMIIELMYNTVKTILLLIAPVLIGVVVVAIVINVLQTVTQIKDQALTFGPKILVALTILLFLCPWYLHVLENYFLQIFELLGKGIL